MIKCPKCSSVEQVELLWCDNCSRTEKHEYEYKCDCGCKFEVIFAIKEIKEIIEDDE